MPRASSFHVIILSVIISFHASLAPALTSLVEPMPLVIALMYVTSRAVFCSCASAHTPDDNPLSDMSWQEYGRTRWVRAPGRHPLYRVVVGVWADRMGAHPRHLLIAPSRAWVRTAVVHVMHAMVFRSADQKHTQPIRRRVSRRPLELVPTLRRLVLRADLLRVLHHREHDEVV